MFSRTKSHLDYLSDQYKTFFEIVEMSDYNIKKADEIIDVTIDILENEKCLNVTEQGEKYSQWFEILICSAYLYAKVFDDEEPFLSPFKAREYYSEIANQCNISSNILEFIFQGVESCNGNRGPQKLKPPPDTPGEALVHAIWLIKNGYRKTTVTK